MSAGSLAKSYRKRAEECFALARETSDDWTRKALEDLGFQFLEEADELQPRNPVWPDAVATADRDRARAKSAAAPSSR